MSEYFPTDFAQKIGREVSIYPVKDMEKFIYDLDSEKKKKRERAKRLLDLHERMTTFQNLAIVSPFKKSLTAYRGIELDKSQRKALKLIHKTTMDWAKGKFIDKVLSQLCNSNSGREVKELSDTLIRVLGMDTEGGASGAQGLEAYVITRNAKV